MLFCGRSEFVVSQATIEKSQGHHCTRSLETVLIVRKACWVTAGSMQASLKQHIHMCRSIDPIKKSSKWIWFLYHTLDPMGYRGTLPENISPENGGPLESEIPSLETIILWGKIAVSFRDGINHVTTYPSPGMILRIGWIGRFLNLSQPRKRICRRYSFGPLDPKTHGKMFFLCSIPNYSNRL